MGDHCSRARTTTATVDWLPRPSHVWLQLHRQMVPRPLPLEAGRENEGLCLAIPVPQREPLRSPGSPKGLTRAHLGARKPACPSWAHSPTTSSFTKASPSTLRPDASEPSGKMNSASHTLRAAEQLVGQGGSRPAQRAACSVRYRPSIYLDPCLPFQALEGEASTRVLGLTGTGGWGLEVGGPPATPLGLR